MDKKAKIYIAGHKGLIGSALVNRLRNEGFTNLVYRTHQELDLTSQIEVEKFFRREKPQYVILAAAKVGGIKANISYPAQFIFENLAIQNNVIHYSYLHRVEKLLFFGSACSYPSESSQPIKEECLLRGSIEPTNEPYAIAKIAGMKMCQAYNRQYNTNFISTVLTNTYGPGDSFDTADSHVIPALIKKFHDAKTNKASSIIVWGSGKPRREFIYVDDVADAVIFLMNNYDKSEIINLSVGADLTIKELANIVKKVVGYKGKISFDSSKPDGIPQKMLDASKLRDLGWQVKTPLKEGIKRTYEWYVKHLERVGLKHEVRLNLKK